MIPKKNPSIQLRNSSTTANTYSDATSPSSSSQTRYYSPDASQILVPVLVICNNTTSFVHLTSPTLSTLTLPSIFSLLQEVCHEDVRIRYGAVSVRLHGRESTFLQFYSEQEFEQVMRFVEGTGKKCERVTVSIEGEKGAGSPGRGDGGYVYGEEVKNVPMEGRAGKPGMERGKVDGMQDVNEGVEVTPVTLVLRKWIDEWSSCAAQRSENL